MIDQPLPSAPVSQTNVLRLLILGAHPDDAEFHAGGLSARYRRGGHLVRMVSVTNGAAGHHLRTPGELAAIRREEARNAARVIGAESAVWDFPDGQLQATLELRQRIIAEIRTFHPDLVVTHRPNDYHPDHRAVGQAVQDASFLVTVPRIVPDIPALRKDPVVASMVDLFTVPCPFRADVVLDVTEELPAILEMLACHHSQVFEWLPYNLRIEDEVPRIDVERQAWLRQWFRQCVAPRTERFRVPLEQALGRERLDQLLVCEAYEISEYATAADSKTRRRLFLGDPAESRR